MRKIIDKIIEAQEHDLSISQITEGSTITEQEFILILQWFIAKDNYTKGPIADQLKERMPGVEPWTWNNAFRVFLGGVKSRSKKRY